MNITDHHPLPWSIEDLDGAGYAVRDASGVGLAYFYGRATETEAMQAKVPTLERAKALAEDYVRVMVAERD